MLTISTINRIVNDIAPTSATLTRVGIIGSYATGENTSESDVDLVFDTGGKLIDEAVMTAGLQIKAILSDQFNTQTDIVNYHTILNKCNNDKCCHHLETLGYKHMLESLIWIWRKTV